MAVIKKTFFSHKSQVDGQKIGLEGVECGGVDGGEWNEEEWGWSGEKQSGVQ